MRRATAIAAIAAVGMIALAENASAFHGKSVRYVVYPSYCSPYTYLYYPVRAKTHTPCWYKHQLKAAYRYGCYPGTGCSALASNAVWGGCYSGCGGYGGCYGGGCGSGGCGSDCGLDGCDGGCSTGGCSTGGCGTSGCAGCNGGSGSTVTDGGATQGEVIYDGPAPGSTTTEPAPADPVPAEDTSASKGQQSPFRLTATTRREATQATPGAAAFERGVRMMRDGQTQQSLEAFYEASSAEPTNAMYLYHQAIALHDTQGAEAAQATLEQAIEAERHVSVPNWGKRMERVQGRTRLWVEKARRDAGLTK